MLSSRNIWRLPDRVSAEDRSPLSARGHQLHGTGTANARQSERRFHRGAKWKILVSGFRGAVGVFPVRTAVPNARWWCHPQPSRAQPSVPPDLAGSGKTRNTAHAAHNDDRFKLPPSEQRRSAGSHAANVSNALVQHFHHVGLAAPSYMKVINLGPRAG